MEKINVEEKLILVIIEFVLICPRILIYLNVPK